MSQHVIFGTGAVGQALAAALLRRGETAIRLVNRSGRTPAGLPPDVETVGGDARDPAFAVAAARGARVVYQVLNPPYDRWAEEFPALQAGVLAAAEAAGARLVSMENVYLYGRSGGRSLTEDSPHAAHTRKGRLRGAMSRELLAAHAAGRVEVAIGRASDYYGPGGGAQSNLGDRVFPAVLAGKTATVLGDPDQPHTYSYVPDIAEGLAVLGEHPAATGRVWHLPNDPSPATTRELVDLARSAAGTRPGGVRATPWPLLRLAGLRNRTVRELLEMRYEFDEPFLVDSSRITRELGVTATPYGEAIAATLAGYRAGAAMPASAASA
jgi:nucleoside-diphosphate-sugar epimerase